jgi:anti-sigma B factor antagonist
MSPLAITSQTVDSAVVLTVAGEIDLSNCRVLYASLSKTLARGIPVVLDMTGVGFIDSRGMVAILQARHEQADVESPVLLTVPSPPVARLLDLVGTGGVLPLFPNRAEAISFLAASQAQPAFGD